VEGGNRGRTLSVSLGGESKGKEQIIRKNTRLCGRENGAANKLNKFFGESLEEKKIPKMTSSPGGGGLRDTNRETLIKSTKEGKEGVGRNRISSHILTKTKKNEGWDLRVRATARIGKIGRGRIEVELFWGAGRVDPLKRKGNF